jgi:hypothetical protein
MSRLSPHPAGRSQDGPFTDVEHLPSSRVLRDRATGLRDRADDKGGNDSFTPTAIAMRRCAGELELLAAVLEAPTMSMVDAATATRDAPVSRAV